MKRRVGRGKAKPAQEQQAAVRGFLDRYRKMITRKAPAPAPKETLGEAERDTKRRS